MESIWKQYQELSNDEAKQSAWKDLIVKFIEEFCQEKCSTPAVITEFANVLGGRFLSDIDEQCILCKDDPDQLLTFLSKGYGCHLLLALNLYGTQITSCADELCNVLLSILHLIFHEKHHDPQMQLEDIFPIKIDPSSFKTHYHNLTVRLSGLEVKFDDELTGSSDELSDPKEDELEETTIPFNEKIKNLHFDKISLFYQILSSFLGLSDTSILSRDCTIYMSYIDKCLQYMLKIFQNDNQLTLLHSHYYGLTQAIAALLIVVAASKDGVSEMNCTNLFQKFHNVCKYLMEQMIPMQDVNVFLLLNLWRTIIISTMYSLNDTSDVDPERTKLLTHFVKLNFFELLKKLILLCDKANVNSYDDVNEGVANTYTRHSFSMIDMITKHLVKICKHLKGIKGSCIESQNKQRKMGRKKVMNSKRAERTKHFQQFVSSDDEIFRDGDKTSSQSDYHIRGKEGSTENLSDFDNSEGDRPNKEVKSKADSHACKKDHCKRVSEDVVCFFSSCCHTLLQIFCELENPFMQEVILRTLYHMGICHCIDLDPFIISLINKLPLYSEEIVDKTLSLVSHLVVSMSAFIVQDQKLTKCLSRSASSSQQARNNPNCVETEEGIEGDESELLKVEGNTKSLQFIQKFKTFLKSSDIKLKGSILKHLKTMAIKLPLSLQTEIFTKIIFPYFRLNFPVVDRRQKNVKISTCEPVLFISSYLELLLIYLKLNDQMVCLFYTFDGVEITKWLARHEDEKISLKAVHILEYISWLCSSTYNSYLTMKSKVTLTTRSDNSIKIDDVSKCAMSALITTLEMMFNDIEVNTFKFEDNTSLLEILTVVENLYSKNNLKVDSIDKQMVRSLCEKLFRYLVEIICKEIESIEDNVREDAVDISKKEIINSEVMKRYSRWMSTLLPLCIQDFYLTVQGNQDIEELLVLIRSSFLHDVVLFSENNVLVCLDILKCSTASRRKLKTSFDNAERDEGLIASHDDIPLDEEQRKTNCAIEEELGYEADQESDNSDLYSPVLHSVPHTVDFKPTCSQNSKLLASILSKPTIVQPWLIEFLLKFLGKKFETDEKFASNEHSICVLNAVFNEILNFQVISEMNNICLSSQGLLCLLLSEFTFVFTFGFSTECQSLLESIIIHLASHEVKTVDLKAFLLLFKQTDTSVDYLSTILLKIANLSLKQFGPRYYLQFPALLNNEENIKKVKYLHRAKAFMIPKQDPQVNPRPHNESWSSVYEVNGPVLKPLGYSSQPPGYEFAVIQLDLESHFIWPDKEFSISLWYMIEDNSLNLFDNQTLLKENQIKIQRSVSLLPRWTNEAAFEYGCEELLHLCSFGGLNAIFEVWVGARTGYLQYRWVTTDMDDSNNEQLLLFDQVVLPHYSDNNKWHHLVVTLVVPSQPHTAEIFTYLDGCELPRNTIKYPSHVFNNQTKLMALLGHGVKQPSASNKNESFDRGLKTGMFMIFQGKHSFRIYKKRYQEKKSAVVDKLKAVFLYSLGPDSSTIDHDYQQYFSTQNASHMDSSLNWDSMVFKELSLFMSILSEDLIANEFPRELIDKPKDILSTIQTELQNSRMLLFNPQCPKEFLQFIPQFKSSGMIQHTYMNDDPLDNLTKHNDGVCMESLLLSDIDTCKKKTLQDALHASGGMSTLLYLHALVARDEHSEVAQSAVLRVIFSLLDTCPFLQREMNDSAGYVLIGRTLNLSPCKIEMVMIRAILESICDGEIFLPSDDEHDTRNIINTTTTAIVKNVCILQTILREWNLLSASSLEVQETLWKLLEALVRPKHPHLQFNIMQFQRARVVENMLMGCHEFQQESTTQLSQSLSKLFIGVIDNLLGQVDLPILRAVCNFLIAIHPTLDTLTLHSARNFYLNPKAQGVPSHAVKARKDNIPPRRDRMRRPASFCETDMQRMNFSKSAYCSPSPQLIISQEDLSTGALIKSEVIIHRHSITSYDLPDDQSLSLDCNSSAGTDVEDGAKISSPTKPQKEKMSDKSFDIERPAPLQSTPHRMKKSHRRIQSDGNIKFLSKSTASDLKAIISPLSEVSKPLPESQDYDIISDSELPSSCDGHEDYLVVDGFIDQTMESFTPQDKEDSGTTKPDVLYHLRLGLMELLHSTLASLPDNMITRVFGTILKVEHLLVLVNQTSDKLREVAFQNLLLYLQRGGRDCFANFNRFMGCHLLANQLHQHPVTVRIMDSCISLLVSKQTTLTHEMASQADICEEDICPMAIVPCLTVLEGFVQKPACFEQMIQFLLKLFNHVESLPLLAFDAGLPDIISNIVYTLANENSGSMQTNWKKETFCHLLKLLDWLVGKACCTCQSLYFQMFKDLQLSLEQLDSRERLKKGITPVLLYQTCRFLKYFLIQTALKVFKANDLYSSKSGMLKKSKSLIQKIRGSVQIITPPTVATPAELQDRFHYVLLEAVKMATLFNKGDHVLDVVMFGQPMKFLKEDSRLIDSNLGDADREFCQDLLEWFFECVNVSSSSEYDHSSWCTLLNASREEIISQANRVILHFLSPARSKEMRLHFIKQIVTYRDNKNVMQSLLFGHTLGKVRDRFLACLHSILSIPQAQLTPEEVELLKHFKNMTRKMNLVKINDQKLIEEMREIKHKKREEEVINRKDSFKRISERNAALCHTIADHGMDVSKVIVEEQDRQRQRLLRIVRGNVSKDVEVRKTWKNLIHHLTQERATWYCKDSYPCSWQLDPTEGPSRMRKRLQRCHLEIARHFFMDDAPAKLCPSANTPLSYLFEAGPGEDRPTYYSFKTNDTIRFLFHCKRVAPGTKTSGELLIGETHMYFVGDDILDDNNVTQVFFGERDIVSISWRYEEIHEILLRRYSLQDNALEIFLTSGRTFLLSFENTKNRDEVFEQLMSRELPNIVTTTMDLTTLTNRWREGSITNFEYLTELNKKAGRSFNDLMQYPVFPFVIADYESEVLNLHDSKSFRNLAKPIACQDRGKEEHYIETYNYLKGDFMNRKEMDPDNATQPYHYSSHYSNSGTVLHFLVRLPPFTSMFLKYQDNQFDIPDRTFNSMCTAWKLSSYISNTDVKELIPEFFFLQEFFMNSERYDMGVRQNKQRVDHVTLPDWAEKNSRLFTLIHMQALESHHISVNLENWIDLTFGYKQTGPPAVKATNVFHPATYFGLDVNTIKDKIQRRALQTMIETYGQTPLQLFESTHPKRFSKNSASLIEIFPSREGSASSLSKERVPNVLRANISDVEEQLEKFSPLPTLVGLQWGDYCGSPSHSRPTIQWIHSGTIAAKRIITSMDNLSAYLCGRNICVLTKNPLSESVTPIGMLTWGHHDSLLHIRSFDSKQKSVFNPMRPDRVTCCEYIHSLGILFVGGESGVLNVWPVGFSAKESTLDAVGAKQNLLGHDDAMTTICVCQPYSIAVTASKDRTAILWDLNRLCYIRSIPRHANTIDCVAISDSSGDIATSSYIGNNGIIHLWTVNAKFIGKVQAPSHVRCMCFSHLSDGIAVNAIAAGFQDGVIRMWNTWTLKPLRNLQDSSRVEPVIAIQFSMWNPLHLFSADASGKVYVWTTKDIASKPSFYTVSPDS